MAGRSPRRVYDVADWINFAVSRINIAISRIDIAISRIDFTISRIDFTVSWVDTADERFNVAGSKLQPELVNVTSTWKLQPNLVDSAIKIRRNIKLWTFDVAQGRATSRPVGAIENARLTNANINAAQQKLQSVKKWQQLKETA